jgi:hypothetical protein
MHTSIKDKGAQPAEGSGQYQNVVTPSQNSNVN